MNVVIVTGDGPQHKHLSAQLVETGHVVGILHSTSAKTQKFSSYRRLKKQLRARGRSIVAHYVAGRLFTYISRSGGRINSSKSESDILAAGIAEYERIPSHLIHRNCDFRNPSSLELLRSFRPDLVLCMGGPIYPREFLEIAPLTLNFHSGLSPIYNGASSIHFAFANGHPHLCGGTLMKMTSSVDGGSILGHYLPEILSGDTPDVLLKRTQIGAAIIYKRLLLSKIEPFGNLPGISQPPPLFYTRAFDLGWYQRAMIQMNVINDMPAKHQRKESIVAYWQESSASEAFTLYQSTIDRVLWQRDKVHTNAVKSIN